MNRQQLSTRKIEGFLPARQKNVLMLLMFSMMALVTNTRVEASSSYSFTLPFAATTSAGVYKSDGTLVRTLWRKVAYSAGPHNSSPTAAPFDWDNNDDNGNALPAGTYTVRVLYHNVAYNWDGIIGNTSSSFTGTGVHFNFLPITAMAFSGTNGYYCASYNEAHYDFTKFNTSDPQTATDHFAKYYDSRSGGSIKNHASDIYCRKWALAAADGSNVYYASPDSFDTATINSYGKPGFVVKYNVADDSVAYFTTGGQQLASGPNDDPGWGDAHQYRVYPSALQVGTQPGVSGLAVQVSGSILAVSVGVDNKVYLYNKSTGASLGNFVVTNPQGMAFAPSGDLWVISGTTVKRYTGVGGTNTLATTISGFAAPLAVAVNPSNSEIVLVADGGSSQQVKGYTSTGTAASGWSTAYGLAGGYATNGPAVATNKFWFKVWDGGVGTFLAFQPDGSFWVGDAGNMRSLHFSAARAYIGQIQYSQYVRTVSVDLNTPTRVFNGWLEYQVDYTKTLNPGDPSAAGGNLSWQLVKDWGYGLSSLYTANGLSDNGLQTVVTLNNGRTWGMVNRTDGLREIVELQSGGLHPTGITFSNSSSLYANGDIRDYSVSAGILTVTRRQVSFDASGNPTWGTPTTLASAPAGATDPVFHGGYSGNNGPRFPSTSSGLVISFDSSPYIAGNPNFPGNLGMHLGGVQEGASQWLWKSSPGYMTGGVDGNQPDGLGSYSVDGDSFGGWDGTTAWTAGRNVLYYYDGQWSNFMNQWMHFWDDGLFIGQFGATKASGGVNFPDNGPAPQFASNAFSPCVVQVGNTLYAYQADEMVHSGVHRWSITGTNTIAETTSSLTPVVANTLVQTFETSTSGSFTQALSSGNAQSPSSTPPDGSAHVGRIDGVNTVGLAYPINGLTLGQGVSISCQANNDNSSGDPRGFLLSTMVYLSNGTLSRRIDTPTSALQTWQTLSQNLTVQQGEDHIVCYFETAFNQPKGFADNLSINVAQPGIPAAPTGLTASPGDAEVNLSWAAAPGATSYNIYAGTATGGESAQPIATGITGTSYTATGLSNGTTYYYEIKAVSSAGTSGYSNEANAAPFAQIDLIVTGITMSPANPVAGDHVVFSCTVKNKGHVATSAGTIVGLSFQVDGATVNWEDTDTASLAAGASRVETATGGPGNTNYWTATSGSHTILAWVDDINRMAEGNENNNQLSTSITVGGSGIAAAPTGLTATGGSAQIGLSWTASSGATSYNVYRGTTAGGESATAIATGITGTIYTDTGLANSTAYFYTVKAVNASGSSAASNEATATTTGASVLLSRTGWIASAFQTAGGLSSSNVLDGNTGTQWQSGSGQANGQWFMVDMVTNQTFDKVVLNQASATADYPVGYQVFVSTDGATWGTAIATGAGTSGASTTITFPTQTKRYIKVVETGTSGSWWSISEFYVYY